MDYEDEWSSVLTDHPIFSRSTGSAQDEKSFELSTSTLPNFTNLDPEDDSLAPSGRRQTMVIKDSEVILAVGREMRVAALGDAKFNRGPKAYKVRPISPLEFNTFMDELDEVSGATYA